MVGVVKESTWTRLIYLGRRGDATAWRAEEKSGGVVLFLMPTCHIEDLVLRMGLKGRVRGSDPMCHAELCELLATRRLLELAGHVTAQSQLSHSRQAEDVPSG